jgi:hypothetical protein
MKAYIKPRSSVWTASSNRSLLLRRRNVAVAVSAESSLKTYKFVH